MERHLKDFIKGVDVSFLDEIEDSGGRFYSDGIEKDCLSILHDHGVNMVRLRIWNAPLGGYCNLERTLAMAKRVVAQGMALMLDFHYSDSWADPGSQTKPRAWVDLDQAELEKAVYAYTKHVMQTLGACGIQTAIVQIGNEITNGMLWDAGRIHHARADEDQNWDDFSGLLRSGIQAVHDGTEPGCDPLIMIHIDRGADNSGSRHFFDHMMSYGVPFDLIGLSYYPWWHGTLQAAKANIDDLALRYGKNIVVVETAYPWALHPRDGQGPIVHSKDQLHAGYPASVEGQHQFLLDLMELVRGAADARGIGVVYWEPCWIPIKEKWSVGHANNWDNLTLFDGRGHALRSLMAFDS